MNQNILSDDHNPNGMAICIDIEVAVFFPKLHQIERSQITSRVIDKHIFAARIRSIDSGAVGTGMPVVYCGIKL